MLLHRHSITYSLCSAAASLRMEATNSRGKESMRARYSDFSFVYLSNSNRRVETCVWNMKGRAITFVHNIALFCQLSVGVPDSPGIPINVPAFIFKEKQIKLRKKHPLWTNSVIHKIIGHSEWWSVRLCDRKSRPLRKGGKSRVKTVSPSQHYQLSCRGDRLIIEVGRESS